MHVCTPPTDLVEDVHYLCLSLVPGSVSTLVLGSEDGKNSVTSGVPSVRARDISSCSRSTPSSLSGHPVPVSDDGRTQSRSFRGLRIPGLWVSSPESPK